MSPPPPKKRAGSRRAERPQPHTNFRSARDFESRSSQVGETDPISDETKFRTQWVVSGNAQGPDHESQVADAVLLMRMLGVHPDDTWAEDMILPVSPRYNNTPRKRGGKNAGKVSSR